MISRHEKTSKPKPKMQKLVDSVKAKFREAALLLISRAVEVDGVQESKRLGLNVFGEPRLYGS
jgi:uncharacterized pyridoxal phosphate-containing UPF0001 family protein